MILDGSSFFASVIVLYNFTTDMSRLSHENAADRQSQSYEVGNATSGELNIFWISINFIVGSYKDLSDERVITIILIRSDTSFGFNYRITPSLTRSSI